MTALERCHQLASEIEAQGWNRELYQELNEKYPIVLTRDLDLAKDWVRKKSRGSERYCSSKKCVAIESSWWDKSI